MEKRILYQGGLKSFIAGSSNNAIGGASDSNGNANEAMPMMQSAQLNSLKNKLEDGDLLSDEEIEEMKKYIEGLRATAAYLQQSANELENKLNEQLV